ncbi:hypothetical protein [Streptomyces anandii]|uniref:hypothetical protein n=1 Tax=Streptomyces anandii TaxID=285454 RepID=UPI00378A2272
MLTLSAPAFGHSSWLGSFTLSGLAACMLFALVLGVRGSDRVKIDSKEKVTGWALVTGSVCLAAGGNWRDIITGIGSIPNTAVSQSGFNNWGAAGMAIFLTLAAWGPKWKKLRWPALFALAASMYWIEAGGVGAVLLNSARLALGNLGGAG